MKNDPVYYENEKDNLVRESIDSLARAIKDSANEHSVLSLNVKLSPFGNRVTASVTYRDTVTLSR